MVNLRFPSSVLALSFHFHARSLLFFFSAISVSPWWICLLHRLNPEPLTHVPLVLLSRRRQLPAGGGRCAGADGAVGAGTGRRTGRGRRRAGAGRVAARGGRAGAAGHAAADAGLHRNDEASGHAGGAGRQSRSMSVPDAVGGQTRWEALRRTLDDARRRPGQAGRGVRGQGLRVRRRSCTRSRSIDGKIALPESPDGEQTAIGAVLDDVLRQRGGQAAAWA